MMVYVSVLAVIRAGNPSDMIQSVGGRFWYGHVS